VSPSGISRDYARGMADDDEFVALKADARYAREKLDLYRAKAYGGRATSAERMRQLERHANETLERLRFAQRQAAAAKAADGS
jgi:hypothetical protein